MAVYTAPIFMRYTGTTAANSAVWAMRAGSNPLTVRRIVLFSSFDGTGAATSARHEMRRFRTAMYTGGSSVVAVPKDVASSASGVTILQDTAGGALTVGSVTVDDPMMVVGSCPRGVSGAVALVNLDLSAASANIIVAANDGIVIRNSIVAVVGDAIAGFVEWSE